MSKLSVYKNLVREVYDAMEVKPRKIYLDAGCGTGNLVLKIARQGRAKAYGIDSSLPMIKQAVRKCRKETATLAHSNLNMPLPFRGALFNGVACVHTLYLLDDPLFTLQEFQRVLKRGSRLVLVDPKKDAVNKSHMDREYLRVDGLVYLANMPSCVILAFMDALPFRRITLRRANFLTDETLEDLLRQVSFEIVKTKLVYGDTSTLIVAKKK